METLDQYVVEGSVSESAGGRFSVLDISLQAPRT